MKGILFILVINIFTVFAVTRPRGVSLEKASFYQADRDFRCLSDGKVIPWTYVNDDYCDCADGSDEPGTSACPQGVFFCENKQFKGTYIKSSRVDDGVCDCCDGSDETDGTVDCENTCIAHYKKEMAQQEAVRRTQEEGYKVKQEYMQQGKRAKDEKLAKLSEVERENEILKSEKETAEAAKNAAEEPETIAKEEHKKAWEKVKEELQKAKDAAAALKAFTVLDVNQDGIVDYPEIMNRKEFDIDSDGTVSEEESKEYLEDSEKVDVATFTEKIWPNIKEIFKVEELESPPPPEGDEESSSHDEEGAEAEKSASKEIPLDITEGGSLDDEKDLEDIESYNDDEDDDDDDDDADSEYDITNKKDTNPSTPSEETEPEYSEETKNLIAAADEVRTKFDEAERKLRDSEREISDIKKYMEIDFGPNEEFATLKGKCFEYTDREYTYTLCPFDRTSQKNKNGGMETSLGTWGKWNGPDDSKHEAMKYENGQGCWNGPTRSTVVNLHCGPTNEVTRASEPSRCEYMFEFTTPAKCSEPKPAQLKDVHEEL